MKKITLGLIILFSLNSWSQTYQGAVESTGLFYRAGWSECEINQLSKDENQIKLQLTLRKGQGSSETYQAVQTLTSKGITGFLGSLRWDYGASETFRPVAGSIYSSLYQYRVQFLDNGNSLKYRMYFHEMYEGASKATYELTCKANLKQAPAEH